MFLLSVGKQEGAAISYNPKKPGRPSHTYHTHLMAGLRLVVGAEVHASDKHSGSHSLPGLLKILGNYSPLSAYSSPERAI